MDYINPEIVSKLEDLYGENVTELIDYEMRKIIRKKGEYIMRFGINLEEFTDITQGGFFNYGKTGFASCSVRDYHKRSHCG